MEPQIFDSKQTASPFLESNVVPADACPLYLMTHWSHLRRRQLPREHAPWHPSRYAVQGHSPSIVSTCRSANINTASVTNNTP